MTHFSIISGCTGMVLTGGCSAGMFTMLIIVVPACQHLSVGAKCNEIIGPKNKVLDKLYFWSNGALHEVQRSRKIIRWGIWMYVPNSHDNSLNCLGHFIVSKTCKPHGGTRGKVQGVTKEVCRIHPLGNVNISTRFCSNPPEYVETFYWIITHFESLGLILWESSICIHLYKNPTKRCRNISPKIFQTWAKCWMDWLICHLFSCTANLNHEYFKEEIRKSFVTIISDLIESARSLNYGERMSWFISEIF